MKRRIKIRKKTQLKLLRMYIYGSCDMCNIESKNLQAFHRKFYCEECYKIKIGPWDGMRGKYK